MNEKIQTKIWENGNKGRCKKTRNQSFFWGGSDWTLRSLKDGRILFSMSWLTNKLYEYRDKIMNNVFSHDLLICFSYDVSIVTSTTDRSS